MSKYNPNLNDLEDRIAVLEDNQKELKAILSTAADFIRRDEAWHLFVFMRKMCNDHLGTAL